MVSVIAILLLFLIKLQTIYSTSDRYSFSEELLIESLPNSRIHFNFQFESNWKNKDSNNQTVKNYGLFPKRIGDIASKFSIEELHLTLSQGTWKYYEWGVPSNSAPSGSELWILFGDEVSHKVDLNWLQSSRAISGLFGLSININDNPNTVCPNSAISLDKNSKKNLRYATLPNEIFCTENLTPWIKLLPCGKSSGLAGLLRNSHKLYDSDYFSAELHLRKKCDDGPLCNSISYELKQKLSLVYNSEAISQSKSQNIYTFSLLNIFGNKIDAFCPAADLSNIYIDIKDNQVIQDPIEIVHSKNVKRSIKLIDLKKLRDKNEKSFEINPTFAIQRNSDSKLESILNIHRYITNTNEKEFGLKTQIKNNLNQDVSIIYFDTIPWYFRVFISSLTIRKEDDNTQIQPDFVHFTPGLDRKRAHHTEIKLNLKANTIYSIYFKMEMAYLKWDEYPPDVNHGFYINPALVTVLLNDSTIELPQIRHYGSDSTILNSINSDKIKTRIINLYTETLLMNLPTPDFSMPYNVICLTCTVVAIAFGSLHNFTTRKFKFIEKKSMKEKVFEFINKLRKKPAPAETVTTQETDKDK